MSDGKPFVYAAGAVMMMVIGLCISCTSVPRASQRAVDVDPDRPDPYSTGLESRDVRAVASVMAADLLNAPAIQSVSGVPRIAVNQVKNLSRHRGDGKIIARKLRTALIRHAGDKIDFVDRSRTVDVQLERERKRQGVVDSTELKPRAGVDFFLRGEIRCVAKGAPRGISDYVLYTFWLVDAETEIVVWENDYETKRVSTRGTAYSGTD